MVTQAEIVLDCAQKSLQFAGRDYGGLLHTADWELLDALSSSPQPLEAETRIAGRGKVKDRSRELTRRLPPKLAGCLIAQDKHKYRLGAVVALKAGADIADEVDGLVGLGNCVPADYYVTKYANYLAAVKTKVEMVGPDEARKYLAFNIPGADERSNRHKRKGHIARCVRAIRNGTWKFTHQGIGFDTNGRLVDGQHRLEAIIIAGIPVPMLVTRGLDPECYYGVDIGQRRTLGDILALDKRLAEPFRLLTTLLTGRTQVAAEEMELLVQTPMLAAGERMLRFCSTHRSGFTSSAVRAAVLLAMISRPQDEDYALLLYAGLAKHSYNGLPEVAQTYNRQLEQAVRGSRDTTIHMLRTLYMLDKNNAPATTIAITSDMVARRTKLIREWLRIYVNNPDNKPEDLLQQLAARQQMKQLSAKEQRARDLTPLLYAESDDNGKA